MHEIFGRDANALGELFHRYGETYAAGDVIFRQHEKGEALYVVLRGTVELVIEEDGPGQSPLRTLGPGDVLGETSCFAGLPHSASAVALEESG